MRELLAERLATRKRYSQGRILWEFPDEGWPTSYAALRHNPIPIYGLGWCIPRDYILPYLHSVGTWSGPSDLRAAAFWKEWLKDGLVDK